MKPYYGKTTQALIALVEGNSIIKNLLIQSIEQARKINPDRNTNPAQNLEEYYDFITWAEKALPWNVLPNLKISTMYEQIDQCLCYFYFINDQPLREINDQSLYNNSLQYMEPYTSWMVEFNKTLGAFLDTEESWKEEYYHLLYDDKRFGLNKDWYEHPSNWKTFNQFFSRYLKSPDKRPISEAENDSVIVSPADAVPQGVWEIDENGYIIQQNETIFIKSAKLNSIESLIGEGSAYQTAFKKGIFTHAYLGVSDYHRYHFPISGIVREIRIIPAQCAAGCYITWDAQQQKYVYDASIPGWQSVETRACVIVENEHLGLVALLPVGMSQVCSVNFEKEIQVGHSFKKGDMLGYFLFGGSDFILIFQEGVKFELTSTEHLLMGEEYGRIR